MSAINLLHIRSGRSNRYALFALGVGAFGIGLTEFVIMGLLIEVSVSLGVTISSAGLLITGYALGVTFGGPVLTILAARLSQRRILIGLMAIFTIGNLACALSGSYGLLMGARIITGFAHGTFFGVGAVVAAGLVAPERKASAIALMFTGLTLANVLGVPFGTWIGQQYGWRSTFWTVSIIGVIALLAIIRFVPSIASSGASNSFRELRILGNRGAQVALAMTVLGYAGVFLLFTFIAPVLIDISGFEKAWVSPLLLLFGVGLVIGNLVGGRLADVNLRFAILTTLLSLTAVLIVMLLGMQSRWGSMILIFLFGAAAFSTVAPLQSFMLSQASGTGKALASTLNISAFNLGNALGAWIGGIVLLRGGALSDLFWVAALPPALAAVIAFFAVKASPQQKVPSCTV